MKEQLRICEVGLRDGLQNEPNLLATETKLQLIDGLVAAGLDYIETGSFVRPDLVPQMADAEAVLQGSLHYPIENMVLVINEHGYDRALAAGAQSVALVVMVSETLSQRNSGKSVTEALLAAERIAKRAALDEVRLRCYISTAWVCPFEGEIDQQRVLQVAESLISLNPAELVLSDTIGHAHPRQVASLFELVGRLFDIAKIGAHFHDTQALGLANAYAAIESGVRIFDGSLGGLGGCPFAPGAAGNLATEDIVFLAHKLGFETGVDLEKLQQVTRFAERQIGRKLTPRTANASDPIIL